jgi:hypothetical protein
MGLASSTEEDWMAFVVQLWTEKALESTDLGSGPLDPSGKELGFWLEDPCRTVWARNRDA